MKTKRFSGYQNYNLHCSTLYFRCRILIKIPAHFYMCDILPLVALETVELGVEECRIKYPPNDPSPFIIYKKSFYITFYY